jgi:multicomponent Na+:H+ antiporter subunit E
VKLSRRWTLQLWVLCWLMLVWVLLWGSFSAANVLSGLVVAALITVLLPLPVVPVEGRLHPVSLVCFAGWVAWYLLLSSIQVAWLAIRPGAPPQSAVLRARMALKSDLVLALAVSAINLTPGSIVLEIDRDRRLLYVHVLDVGTPRMTNQFLNQVAKFERLLIAAFERQADWQPAPEGER